MSRFSVLVVLSSVACNSVHLAAGEGSFEAERAQDGQCLPLGGTYSGIVFTDEEAQNAIDFADHATADELEVILGIGPSIAGRIIAARPFGTQDDPMMALDRVAYVGPTVLTRFKEDSYRLWCTIDDGRQDCCIDLACEGLGGTFSYVSFTDAEAQMVLDWANRADREQLDAVCGIGEFMATNIEIARPLHSIDELDAVPYVGETLMRRFLGHPGHDCVTRATVAEAWCGQADGACECPVDEEPAETGVVTDTELSVDQLPAEVQDEFAAIVAKTDWCEADFDAANHVDRIVQHSVDGVPTGYTVEMTQAAPDFHFGWGVILDVDADGVVLGSDCVSF